MKRVFTFSFLYLNAFLLLTFGFPGNRVNAQCVPLSDAIIGPMFSASSGGTENRSGMAFNPEEGLYYSVNAGNSTYPVDTYDENGNLLHSVEQGYSFRGAWWNPTLNTFECNSYGFDNGIIVNTLEAGTAYPTGTGTEVFTSNQPNEQSVGDLDYDAYEIIYYDEGFIYRYSRQDNGLLGTYAIQGLPVDLTNLNWNSVVYTGCPGHEIGVYDYVNRQLLFINKMTGTYSGFCQLPNDAPARDAFGMSYANNYFWLFENGEWKGYEVVNLNASTQNLLLNEGVSIAPNPAQDLLQINLEGDFQPEYMQVFNLQGQELLQQQIGLTGGITLDITSLPVGSYFLRVQFEEGYALQQFMKIE
jgi:hypothetical protein